MSTEAQKRAAAAYNRRQDNIMIRPDKATGAQIRAAAAAAGKSVQRYILDALTGADAGQQIAGVDVGQALPDRSGQPGQTVQQGQPDEQSAAAWYKPGAVLYIPIGAKTVAALERIAKAGESPLQCAARLLGDAIKAAPVGENGHGAPKGAGK